MSSPPEPISHIQFERPRSATTTTFAVVADVHFTRSREGTWKALDQTEDVLTSAVTLADRREVDAILIVGDVTNDGTATQFQQVDNNLAAAPCPVLAVPGNHDVPGHREVRLCADSWAQTPLTTSFVHSIGGIDVFGLDSTTPTDTPPAGTIDEDEIDHVASAVDSTRPSVGMIHHPLGLGWSSVTENLPTEPFHLGNAPLVSNRLARTNTLVLTGHVHWPMWGVDMGITELVCPAACSYPQAMTILTVGPEGTSVEFVALSDRTGRKNALSALQGDPVLNGAYVELVSACGPDNATAVGKFDLLDWPI